MLWLNHLFLFSLELTTPILVYLMGSYNYYWDYIEYYFKDDITNQVFDFIVVGSGSAGAVVAKRLSKHYKVLLLEAGGDPILFNGIPGLALDLLGYPNIDWSYKTVPQKYSCKGLNNQQSAWGRGKVLGGSSTLNYMFYLRGNPYDYDNWANITGDSEWKYENVLPFFKKSVAEYKGKFQSDKKNYGNSPYGFLTIEQMSFVPMLKEFIQAGNEIGYDEIDVNGPQRSGIGDIEVNQKNGVRRGTYYTLLKNPTNPHNLKISKYSQAVKIHIDKTGLALGIWYFKHGVKKYVSASKEIIVSAGTIDSPKLLMLSGIGPKIDLDKHKITVKSNQPVGQNLQDHVMTTLFPILIDKPISFLLERNMTISTFFDYFFYGKGALTAPTLLNSQLFTTSTLVSKRIYGDWPDLQLFFTPTGISPAFTTLFPKSLNYQDGFLNDIMSEHVMKDGYAGYIILVRPKSRGEIILKDENPFSDPLIDPKYYEHPDDSKRVIEGVKLLIKLAEETKTFQQLKTKVLTNPMQACKDLKFRSDEYWNCYIRHNTVTTWHPVGTCRMGKDSSDPKAVVDSKLRVLGIRRLRVVDASIMPQTVNANPNAPSIMIGEKGAHFILDFWATQYQVCNLKEHLFYLDNFKCYYSRLV